VAANWQVVAVKRDGQRVTLKENVSKEAAESLRNWLSASRSFATVLVAPGTASGATALRE
jgi:hypothetical protein